MKMFIFLETENLWLNIVGTELYARFHIDYSQCSLWKATVNRLNSNTFYIETELIVFIVKIGTTVTEWI